MDIDSNEDYDECPENCGCYGCVHDRNDEECTGYIENASIQDR